jgi:hypothetical protein
VGCTEAVRTLPPTPLSTALAWLLINSLAEQQYKLEKRKTVVAPDDKNGRNARYH